MACQNVQGFNEWQLREFNLKVLSKMNAMERENEYLDFIERYSKEFRERFCSLICRFRHECKQFSFLGRGKYDFFLSCFKTKTSFGKTECNCIFSKECLEMRKERRITYKVLGDNPPKEVI